MSENSKIEKEFNDEWKKILASEKDHEAALDAIMKIQRFEYDTMHQIAFNKIYEEQKNRFSPVDFEDENNKTKLLLITASVFLSNLKESDDGKAKEKARFIKKMYFIFGPELLKEVKIPNKESGNLSDIDITIKTLDFIKKFPGDFKLIIGNKFDEFLEEKTDEEIQNIRKYICQFVIETILNSKMSTSDTVMIIMKTIRSVLMGDCDSNYGTIANMEWLKNKNGPSPMNYAGWGSIGLWNPNHSGMRNPAADSEDILNKNLRKLWDHDNY